MIVTGKHYIDGRVGINTTSAYYTNEEQLRVNKTDDTPNVSGAAMVIDYNVSGDTATGGDKSHIGLRLDVDSSATGGDTSDEHRLYGIFNSLDVTGDSDFIIGMQNAIDVEHTAGTVSNTRGVFNEIDVQSSNATITNVEGTLNDIDVNSANTGNLTRLIGSSSQVRARDSYDDTIATAEGS